MYSNSVYDPLTEGTDVNINVSVNDSENILADMTNEPNVGQFGFSHTDFDEVNTLLDYINRALEAALSAENSAEEVSLIKDQIVAIQTSINEIYNIFSSNFELFEVEYSDFLIKYQDFLSKYALISQMIDDVNLKYEEIVELGNYIKQLGDDIKVLHDQVVEHSLQTSANAILASNAAISAEASMVSANASEVNSKNSEIASKLSETESKNSEINSKLSEVNSKTSEVNSKLSETNAAQSEVSAEASATSATASEVSASSSATYALQSKESAQASETASRISEVNSKQSELESKQSELASKSSEDNAKASETASKTSEVNSKQSEVNAALSAASSQASAIEAANSDTSAINAAASALDSKNSAKASEISAAESALIASNAASIASGALIEAGNVDLSSGIYPTPLKDSSNNPVSCYWKVTVGGVVNGIDYGSGDSLVYSKTISGYYKIDNTESVTSVAGKQGVVTLNKNDVGLSNVDNTSDINKPVSTATQSLLDLKVDKITTINGKNLSNSVTLNASDVGAAPSSHVGSGGSSHATATTLADGFMSKADKSKLDSIAASANNYVHPTSGVTAGTYKSVTVDGNGHVTGGSNPTTVDGYGITDAVKKTGDTMSGPLTIQSNSASSNLLSILNETDGWTWMKMGKSSLANQGHFAWHTGPVEGHAANSFHLRPQGSNTVLGVSPGATTIGSDSYLEFLPNSNWGAKLRVGGNGRTAPNDGLTASITTTNGNVHIDSASGSRGTYLNFYSGTDGVKFGNGAGAGVGSVDAAGNMWMNGTVIAPRAQIGTINGTGASTTWASIDVTGIKGGYAGFNFPDAGHWFGVRPDGLSGIWDSAGTSKWYFTENGVLAGGATVPWSLVTNHPSSANWASTGVLNVVAGQLAWKNYGNGHTIFDASNGTSPAGTAVDKNNSQIAWRANDANYPTLMGWNGTNTYGVRVDSARWADAATSAITSDRITGTVATNGQDLTIHGKRAMVGSGDSNTLIFNYGNDWGSTIINGNVFTGPMQSERLLAIKNGSTVYGDSQIEARSTDGSDARIGFHQAGVAAGSINFSSWGFQFEREAGRGSRANVAAANFFADAAQDMTSNALTRLDYVDGNFLKRRNRLHPDDGTSLDNVQKEFGFNYSTGGGAFGPYISFGGLGGNYECQISAQYGGNGSEIKFRTHNGDSGAWNSWHNIWNSGNFDPNSKLSNNGSGGTLYLNNWFRSTGNTGWYNETWAGGLYMDEASTIKVHNGKRIFTSNDENYAIGAEGSIFSNRRMWVDTRKITSNGGSYNAWRYGDAPFHAGMGGLNVGSFAPIVGSVNYVNGYGYTTRVHFGVVTPSGTGWTNAAIVVGSGENDAQPLASYQFGADGHMTGSSKISTGYLFTERSDATVNLELKNNTNHPGLSFHKPNISWAVLRHDGTRYYMEGDGQNFNIGNDMTCSYAYANGVQPQVANALTRKDYVDAGDFATRWNNAQVIQHGNGDANAHYNSAWDGANVANAPSADWHFFRELYHSGGSNWRHQEAFNFFTDEEWFRRGQNSAGDYGPWCRRWHSGNFNPDTKANLSGAAFTGKISTSNATTDSISSSGGINIGGGLYAGTTVTGNTGVFDGSDRVFSERYHPKFAYDKQGSSTTLWTGSSSSHPTTLTLSEVLSGFSKIRFEGVNAGATIAWATTLSYDELAAICNTGLLVYIASGTYSYTFNSFNLGSTTLSRNTSVNCYLTKIVGIR